MLTRVYWSRPLFAITIAVWLGLALTHRAVLRRRPWTEEMVIITAEKQLAEDIIKATAGLALPQAVQLLAEEGPPLVERLLVDAAAAPVQMVSATSNTNASVGGSSCHRRNATNTARKRMPRTNQNDGA